MLRCWRRAWCGGPGDRGVSSSPWQHGVMSITSVRYGLAAVALSVPSFVAAAPAADASTSRVTVVRVVIAGCPPGCTISAQNESGDIERLSVTARVRDGRATLRVPTALTRGMFFTVTDRAGDQGGEGVSAVVLRYASAPVGRVVSDREARTSRNGQICWAGTRSTDVTFRMRAQRFPNNDARGYDAVRVWASPAVHSIGEMQLTAQGAVGLEAVNQCYL